MAGIVRAFPLTPLQEGMLYHALRSPDSGLYHGQLEATLAGGLDRELFQEAWRLAARRHEVFRTFFAWKRRERPLQVVRDEVELPFRFLDWSGADPGEIDQRWAQVVNADRRTPFDLARAPLMRFTVVRVGPDRHRFLWGVHHAILDGWSGELVMGEVLDDVESLRRGTPPARPAAPSYAQFVGWLEARDVDADRRWWTDTLAGVSGPTPLPAPRRTAASPDRETREHQLSPEHTAAVRAAASSLRVTPATLTVAAWAIVLARHTGSGDLLFGITTSDRPAEIPRVERAAGLYLNTVPIRVRLAETEPAGEWLRGLQRESSEARAHGAPGLSAIRRWSGVDGPELIRSLVVFENFPDSIVHESGPEALTLESVTMAGPSDLPLALLAYPGTRLTLQIVHDPARVTAAEAGALLAEVADVLRSLASTPETVAPLLAPGHAGEAPDWTAGPPLDRDPVDVVDRILAVAEETPDGVALRGVGEAVTYGELAGAMEVGARRVAEATSPGALVGILADRGPAAVTAMLATLRAGRAYVPLDPAAPTERLSAMLASAEAVWAEPGLAGRLPEDAPTLLALGSGATGGAAPHAADREEGSGDPSSAAYVIFTSGSTGAPKGVVVERRHLAWSTAARFAWYREHPRAFLLLSPLHVDSSVAGIYWTLCAGGTLVLPPRRGEQDAAALAAAIADHEVTHTLLVPSLLGALLESVDPQALGSLRAVVVAGEACPEAVVRRHRATLPGVPLFNEYGPSETTVWATAAELTTQPEGAVTIGAPVPGARVAIVDEALRAVPPGEVGELVIGGPGVARGYLGRPDLTAERFVDDPGPEGGRIYRTGDRARWRDDGRLAFLGRSDDQFKIRGYRIEAGEIEKTLRRHPAVDEVVVGPVGEGAGTVLTAWFTAADAEAGAEPDADRLRAFVADALPPYMVPARFVLRSAMPRTAAGKLDRVAVRAETAAAERPVEPPSGGPGAPPRTRTEQALAEVWRDVLGLEVVSTTDDFFAVGGDSLSSIRVISRAARMGLDIRPEDFFDTPTIGALARRIDEGARTTSSAEQGPVTGDGPLTPIQSWFFERVTAGWRRWNQSHLLALDAGIGEDDVTGAVAALLRHHDALRTRFAPASSGERRAVVPAPAERPPLRVVTLPGDAAEAETLIRREAEAAHAALDPSRGDLFRAVFFRAPDASDRRLLLVAHHLVVDAVSWGVLLEDLATLLAWTGGPAPPLPRKTRSFLDWSRGLAERAARPDMAALVAYWTDVPPNPAWATVPLDPDADPDRNVTATAAVHRWVVDAPTVRALESRGGQPDAASLHERLLAAVAAGWARWSGRSGLQLDVESVGRNVLGPDVDVSRTVGWFTVSTPVVIPLPDPSAALSSVRQALDALPLGGAAHGLARHLHPDESVREALAARPRSTLIFNYLGSAHDAVPPGAPFRPVSPPPGLDRAEEAPRAYTFELNVWREAGALVFALEYSTALHGPAAVAAFATEVEGALLDEAEAAGANDPDDAPEAAYPLTPMQGLMLLHELASRERGALTNQICYELRGPLDADALEKAVGALVARHPALRTAIRWRELDHPLQEVHRALSPTFERVDLTELAVDRRAAEAERIRAEDEARAFDVAQAPLLRFTLVRLDPEHHHLLWTVHHLVADRWSFDHLTRELGPLYAAALGEETSPLPPPLPFRRYVDWIEAQDPDVAAAWWRHHLAGMSEPTLLAPPSSTGERTRSVEALEPTEARALDAAAAALGVAATAVVLGAVALAVSRLAGRTDVTVGLTVSGRPPQLDGVEDIVGSFVANVPVRFTLEREQTVGAWLRGVQRAQLRRTAHEHLAPERIHGASAVPADRPLFDLLVVANLDAPRDPAWPGLRVTPLRATLDAGVPLVLQAARDREALAFTLVHDADADHAAGILSEVAAACRALAEASADQPLSTILGDARRAAPRRTSDEARTRPITVQVDEDGDPGTVVRAAWRQILGVDQARADDDFFALGGTSLQGARLLALLEERLDRPVPLAVLAAGRTLGALLAAVRDETPTAHGPLVPLRTGGSGAPLIAVPGVRGNVLLYPPLADALAPGRPVYGLQSRGTEGSEEQPDTMEAIAADFIEQLGPLSDAPFHLFGLCWGAAAAFEMAAQLTRRGTPPRSLGLLDPAVLLSTHPDEEAPRQTGLGFVRDRMGLYWDEFRNRGWRDRGRLVVEKVGRLARTVRAGEVDPSTRQELRERAVIEANLRALERYEPSGVEVPTRLFLTADFEPDAGPDPRLEWLPLFTPEPRIVPVPGVDSGDAIKSHTGALASALAAWLRAADEVAREG